MKALSRQLRLPQASDLVSDQPGLDLLLPRRSTRWLFRILAIVLGVAAGLIYAHFFLERAGGLWRLATAAVGATVGYVLVLMPAALVHHTRRLWLRLVLAYRRRAHAQTMTRAVREAEARVENDAASAQSWNALGVLALLNGDEQRAVIALERACAIEDAADYRVNLAAARAEVREFGEAAELLIAAARNGSVAEAAQHNLGVLLSRRPALPVAQRVVEEVEDLSAPEVLNGLGTWQMAAGRLDVAEQYFARAAEANPAAVGARANLALVQYRRGRLRDALKAMHDAATLDPTNPRLINNLGALLSAGGQPAAGARQLSRAARFAPGSPAVELNRGVVRLVIARYDDALDSFNDPLVRAAYPVETAHNAALALIALDRIEAAVEQLEAGLDHDAEDAGLRNNLACVAWAEGDEERMRAELSRVAHAEDRDALVNLVMLQIEEDSPEGALAIVDELAARGIDTTTVNLMRGLALFTMALRFYAPQMTQQQRREFFRALHLCLRPLETASSSGGDGALEAAVNLALYRYVRLEFEAAAEGFLEVAAVIADDGYLEFCAGTALLEAGLAAQQAHQAEGEALVGEARELLRRARRHLESAAERGQITPDLFCNLGICLYNLGDLEAAQMAFRKMWQLEESVDAANNLAVVHARQGQQLQHEARAVGMASRDRERDLLQKAQTHLSTALHYFVKALEHNRDDPVVHGNIGLAYMLRNRGSDVEAALRHWQLMQMVGGAAARRRYEELTALTPEEGTRARFDETIMNVRALNPRACVTTIPPRLSGPRYALQTVTEDTSWRLLSDDPAVRRALRARDRLQGLEKRMARLSL